MSRLAKLRVLSVGLLILVLAASSGVTAPIRLHPEGYDPKTGWNGVELVFRTEAVSGSADLEVYSG